MKGRAMHPLTKSILLTASALVLWACSGGPPQPPELEETQDTLSVNDASAGTETGCDEGSTVRCMAPTAYDNGGYVTCVAGTKTCSGGHWKECTAHGVATVDPQWAAADVGCAWPPQACDQEASVRSCRKELPPTQYSANCTDVTEVCFGGVWRTCSPASAKAAER
jgi:hypothetical protein